MKDDFEWDKDLENIAYKESHIKYCKEYCDEFFSDGTPDHECTVELEFGYTAKETMYIKKLSDTVIKDCSKWIIYGADGKELFKFNAMQCTLCKAIDIDGRRYLIYNDNLYGYNVLRLDDMREYRYFPKASEYSSDSFTETFIWTDISYNAENHIIAVYGCYWAAPYEFMLYRISDIMKPFTGICYPLELLGWDCYDSDSIEDLTFNNGLTFNFGWKCINGEDYEGGKQLVIAEEEYMNNIHTVQL